MRKRFSFQAARSAWITTALPSGEILTAPNETESKNSSNVMGGLSLAGPAAPIAAGKQRTKISAYVMSACIRMVSSEERRDILFGAWRVKISTFNTTGFIENIVNDSTFNQTHNRSKSVRRSVLILLVASLVLCVAAARELGRWLVVQDPLERSGAIVVLSGGMPYRALDGAKIYREGIAPQVWLTRSQGPGELEELHIDYEGEETYDRKILLHEGVPDSAIRVLDPVITNTVDEERAVFDEMRRSGVARVVIVTSPPHTRRVRTLWRKLAPNSLQAIVRPT